MPGNVRYKLGALEVGFGQKFRFWDGSNVYRTRWLQRFAPFSVAGWQIVGRDVSAVDPRLHVSSHRTIREYSG